MAMKKENLAAKSQTLNAINSLSADTLFAPAECRRLRDNHNLHIRVGTSTQLGAGSGDNTRTLRATSATNPTNHRALEGDGDGDGDEEESVGFVGGYLGPDLGNSI
jgi:hypothetical protein